jgi:hypothetical protein
MKKSLTKVAFGFWCVLVFCFFAGTSVYALSWLTPITLDESGNSYVIWEGTADENGVANATVKKPIFGEIRSIMYVPEPSFTYMPDSTNTPSLTVKAGWHKANNSAVHSFDNSNAAFSTTVNTPSLGCELYKNTAKLMLQGQDPVFSLTGFLTSGDLPAQFKLVFTFARESD